jgi:hypothetical protein
MNCSGQQEAYQLRLEQKRLYFRLVVQAVLSQQIRLCLPKKEIVLRNKTRSLNTLKRSVLGSNYMLKVIANFWYPL